MTLGLLGAPRSRDPGRVVDRTGEAPLPTGGAGRAPPPRLASLVDRTGEAPLPTGGAGRAPPPRLASLVDRRAPLIGGLVVTIIVGLAILRVVFAPEARLVV